MNLNELLEKDISMDLKELTRQYKWYNRQINQAQERLNLKNKLMIFFFILLIYVWGALAVGTMAIFKNYLLQNLVGWPVVLSNLYIYIKFSEYYIAEEQNIIEKGNIKKDELYTEISKALTYLNIEKEDYFSSIY